MTPHHSSCYPRLSQKLLLSSVNDDHKWKSYPEYEEILNNNFFYGHIKFSFRILCQKHRPTPLPAMSSLIFYNHSFPRLISFNVDHIPIFHTPPPSGNIYGKIHRCSKRSVAICACLIWPHLRLTRGGYFITTSL